MDRGGVALVIPPVQEQADANAHEPFAILLPHLTKDTSIEWLEKVDAEKGKLGGFRFGLEFRGARLIAYWFSQATSLEVRGLQEESEITRAVLRGIDPQEGEGVREDATQPKAVAPFKPGQFAQDTTSAIFPYAHPVYWAAAIFYGV